jgi:peptidoglycan/LPS O-acetylase OafA/YrhL
MPPSSQSSLPAKWASVDLERGKEYYPALDGLRGIAILMVVTFHLLGGLYGQVSLPLKVLLLLPHYGNLGVPIFFCLSGFLVSLPFWKQWQAGTHHLPHGYFWKRAIRIIPPYYLSILLVTAAGVFLHHQRQYLMSAFYWMIGIDPYVHDPIDFNGPYWSLIIEIQFYLLLPLLFWAFRRVPFHRGALWTGVILIIAALVCRILLVHLAGGNQSAGDMDNRLKLYASQMDFFGVGMIISFIYYSKKGPPLPASGYWIVLACAVAAAACCRLIFPGIEAGERFSWPTYEGRHAFALILGATLLIVQFFKNSLFYRVFTLRWLVYLGAISPSSTVAAYGRVFLTF